MIRVALAAAALAVALPAGAVTPVTVHPRESAAPMVNPGQGWGLWAGAHWISGAPVSVAANTTAFGDDAPLFSWIIVDFYWSDLEPRPGVFDFTALDQILAYWQARGKQALLRVWVTDDPGWDGPGGTVVPDWVWRAGASYHAYMSGSVPKREPDYASPSYETVYLKLLRRLLGALAQRYDGPAGPVTWWGVEGYGNWGEWHTLWSHYPWPSEQVKHQRLVQLIRLYADTFKKPKIIDFVYDSDSPRNFADFLFRQGLAVALGREGFGMSRNGFIDGLGGPGSLDYDTMEKYYPVSPLIAESDWPYRDMRGGQHGTLAQYLAAFQTWHATWAHLYTDASAYHQERKEIPQALAASLQPGGLGCRPVPTELDWPGTVAAGGGFTLASQWVNRNEGLCWQAYPLAIYLTDATGATVASTVDTSFSQVGWLAGTTYARSSAVAVPANLAPGTYTVRIAWVDAAGMPAFRLGIEGRDAAGRYAVGKIAVTGAR